MSREITDEKRCTYMVNPTYRCPQPARGDTQLCWSHAHAKPKCWTLEELRAALEGWKASDEGHDYSYCYDAGTFLDWLGKA